MSILEQLWALFLLGGAAAMALFTLQTWSRGWIRNEEDNETITRKDHPRSFAFLQLLQVLGVAILLYAGLQALHGWK